MVMLNKVGLWVVFFAIISFMVGTPHPVSAVSALGNKQSFFSENTLEYRPFDVGDYESSKVNEVLVTYNCYPDADHDGFGDDSVSPVVISVEKYPSYTNPCTPRNVARVLNPATTLPAYVYRKGDCHDGDSAIHSKRREVSNGRDDNCNTLVDEPEFIYSSTGQRNTHKSFDMDVMINDKETSKSLTQNNLFYRLTYSRLDDSQILQITDFLRAQRGAPNHLIATLSALSPHTVYRTKVQFYKSVGKDKKGQIIYRESGPESEWYFSTTSKFSDRLDERSRVLLNAFYQYSESRYAGNIGYLGAAHVNGTRFSAGATNMWCTEFVSWLTQSFFGFSDICKNTGCMRDHFETGTGLRFLTFNDGSEIVDGMEDARRGDYLAFDWVLDEALDHSGMFLALDGSCSRRDSSDCFVWTIEGNVGNETKILRRGTNLMDGIRGLGQWEFKFQEDTGEVDLARP